MYATQHLRSRLDSYPSGACLHRARGRPLHRIPRGRDARHRAPESLAIWGLAWLRNPDTLAVSVATEADQQESLESPMIVDLARRRAPPIVTPRGSVNGYTFARPGPRFVFEFRPKPGFVAMWKLRHNGAHVPVPSGGFPWMDSDVAVWKGGSSCRLLGLPGRNSDPCCSPVRDAVAFHHQSHFDPSTTESKPDGMPEGFWIADLAAGGRTRITHPGPDQVDGTPCWSPSGDSLAFVRKDSAPRSSEENPIDVWLARTDGSAERPLTHGCRVRWRSLEWSKDGASVLFTQELPGPESATWGMPREWTLWTVALAGGPPRRLLSWAQLHRPLYGILRVHRSGRRVRRGRWMYRRL